MTTPPLAEAIERVRREAIGKSHSVQADVLAVCAAAARAEAAERAQAALQRAYDLVQSGHGYCKCHDALEPTLARLAAAERELAELRSWQHPTFHEIAAGTVCLHCGHIYQRPDPTHSGSSEEGT